MSQTAEIQDSMSTPSEPATVAAGSGQDGSLEASNRTNRRLLVWGGLSLLWIGYLALGQVNARFWVLGQFKTAYKPIRSIWRVELGSLPGSDSAWMIQAVVLTAIIVFVVGVVAALYLILVPEDAPNEFGDS